MKKLETAACTKIHGLLQRQLDSELLTDESAYLQRHLSDCVGCRIHARQIRVVVEGLRAMPQKAHRVADIPFAHRIIARARNPWYKRYSPARLLPEWPTRRWAGAAAGFAMAASVTAGLSQPAVRQFVGLTPQPDEVLMARPASMRSPVFVNGTTFEPIRVDMLGDRLRTLNRTLKIRPVLHMSDPFRSSLLQQQSLSDLGSLLDTYNIDSNSVEVLPAVTAQAPATAMQPVVFSIENMAENGDLR